MLDPHPTRANILLIDDDDDGREALLELLQAVGHSVTGARGGEEGLALLREGMRPDLILLDLRMPGMNGWEFRLEQRRDASLMDIPVIALTGETSAMAKAIDVATVVHKPVDLDTLQSAIRSVLELRRSSLLAQTEKLAALGRLAASVAHEINNPLAFVKSNMSFLRQQLPELLQSSPEDRRCEVQEVLGESMDGLERIELIVRDILLFGRTHEEAVQPVDVRAAIRLALKVAAGRLRQVELRAELPACSPVRAEPSRLAQVFVNLIVNAADAMENQSRAKSLTIALEESATELAVHITDSGSGIPQQNLEKLFEPFYSTKPVGSGTGLGLFVCRGLIASMGGRIEVDSRPGEGSRFTVRLPLAQALARESSGFG